MEERYQVKQLRLDLLCHSVNELVVYDTGMLFSLIKAVLLNRTTKIIIKI